MGNNLGQDNCIIMLNFNAQTNNSIAQTLNNINANMKHQH